MQCTNSISLSAFPLNIDPVIEEFIGYSHLFFFMRHGLRDVLERAIALALRTEKCYQPPTFTEYDGLLGEVMREYELFCERDPLGPDGRAFQMGNLIVNTSGTYFLETLELVIDMIEAYVSHYIQTVLPACQYDVSQLRWEGDQLMVRLKL